MRMPDPIPTFTYLVSEIKKRHPDLAYIHVTEPRINGDQDRQAQEGEVRIATGELFVLRLIVRVAKRLSP